MTEETPVTPGAVPKPPRRRMSATRGIPEPVVVEATDAATAPTESAPVGAVPLVSPEHDSDPSGWHRRMMDAPRTRETRCRFCGHLYGPWSPVDGYPVEVNGFKQ
jgi:hypothetical protein